MLTPMLKIKLVEKDGVVEFSPPLEETKQKIIFCLKHIVENTHDFPRIEKELFPELRRNKQMVLLPGKGAFTNHVASHGGRGGLPNDHLLYKAY